MVGWISIGSFFMTLIMNIGVLLYSTLRRIKLRFVKLYRILKRKWHKGSKSSSNELSILELNILNLEHDKRKLNYKKKKHNKNHEFMLKKQ